HGSRSSLVQSGGKPGHVMRPRNVRRQTARRLPDFLPATSTSVAAGTRSAGGGGAPGKLARARRGEPPGGGTEGRLSGQGAASVRPPSPPLPGGGAGGWASGVRGLGRLGVCPRRGVEGEGLGPGGRGCPGAGGPSLSHPRRALRRGSLTRARRDAPMGLVHKTSQAGRPP